MLRWFFLTAVACVLLLGSPSAQAETPWTSIEPPQQQFTFGFGLNTTWVVTLGYGVGLPDAYGGHDGMLDLELELPVVIASRGGQLSIGTRVLVPFVDTDADPVGGAVLSAHTGVAWSLDTMADQLGWFVDVGVAPGLFGRKWSAAVDLGYRVVLLAYIRPSSALADGFDSTQGHSAPSSGWLPFAAQHLRISADGGGQPGGGLHALWARVAFEVPLGQVGSWFAPPLTTLPFSWVIGGAGRWEQ